MWSGYLAVGGLEVGNSARALGYSRTSQCPTYWLKDTDDCDTLAAALGGTGYNYEDIQNAPWYDPDIADASSRFLGVYILDMQNVSDSTRTATITQKLQNGGRIGRIRRATRGVRVRAILTAKGQDALEVGASWLDAVLSPGACGSHGDACGVTDMEFFSACPPARGTETVEGTLPGEDVLPGDDIFPGVAMVVPESDEAYARRVDSYRRFFHDVACTSGPFTVEEFVSSDGVHVGKTVEFTITAENPWMYGVTTPIVVPPLVPSVVQDIAYNLNTRPSAELSLGSFPVATNYAQNPSLETNVTGWTSGADAPLPAAQVTGSRVTGELAAVGTASFRVVFAPTSSGAGGNFYADAAVSPIPVAAGTRFSVNIWAAQIVMAGAPVRGDMEVVAIWRTGTTIDRVDALGTIDLDGGYLSVKSILPPAGSDNVFIRVRANMTSWANGDIVRLYTDALAVTVP